MLLVFFVFVQVGEECVCVTHLVLDGGEALAVEEVALLGSRARLDRFALWFFCWLCGRSRDGFSSVGVGGGRGRGCCCFRGFFWLYLLFEEGGFAGDGLRLVRLPVVDGLALGDGWTVGLLSGRGVLRPAKLPVLFRGVLEVGEQLEGSELPAFLTWRQRRRRLAAARFLRGWLRGRLLVCALSDSAGSGFLVR